MSEHHSHERKVILETFDEIPLPVDEAYPLLRDHMPALLTPLPDVVAVTELSREKLSPTETKIRNLWHTAPQHIPAILRKLAPREAFRWREDAVWDDARHAVRYEMNGLGVIVEGENTFRTSAVGTRVDLGFTVWIDPIRIRVPELVFDRFFPIISKTIRWSVEPSLHLVTQAARQWVERGRPPLNRPRQKSA